MKSVVVQVVDPEFTQSGVGGKAMERTKWMERTVALIGATQTLRYLRSR